MKNCFLNATLTDELYTEQPEGYVVKARNSHKVFRLLKPIYSLKQASRAWGELLHSFFLYIDFTEYRADQSLYISSLNDSLVILLVYVDEINVKGSGKRSIDMMIQKFGSKFTVRVMADAKQFIGMFIENNE